MADLEHGDLFLGLEEVFPVDGAVGMEELIGDVGQDGGTGRGDAALGDEDEEQGEELVDVEGGIDLGEFREEVGGGRGGGRCFWGVPPRPRANASSLC